MFESFKAQLKIKSISKLWHRTTGINLDDRDQIDQKTKEYINNLGLSPVDAWITALANWITEIQRLDSKEMTAQSLIYFLKEYEEDIKASINVINTARESALEILNNPEIKHMKKVIKLLGKINTVFKTIGFNTDKLINLAWKNKINEHETALLLMFSAGYAAKESNPSIANNLFELCKLQSYQWSREDALSTHELEPAEIGEYLIDLTKRVSA